MQHLQDVVAWLDVSDVNPLAIDVVTVQVPAAHGDALLPKVGTLVPLGHVCRQEETQLVPAETPSLAS